MNSVEIDRQKCVAAEAAVDRIEDGMLVGLGTGSTVAFAIDALARRCRQGLRVRTVVTSARSGRAAVAAGVPVIDFAEIDRIDIAIDGVDEIDPGLRAIKGAGGAMLREKVVASAAVRMIAIADGSKRVGQLGRGPVPVEVLPMALGVVSYAIRRIGGEPVARRGADDALVRTDQGNIIIDARFGLIDDPAELAAALSAIPGLLGHGLFLAEIDELYLGTVDGVLKLGRDEG